MEVRLVGEVGADINAELERAWLRAESERRHVLLGLLACDAIGPAVIDCLRSGRECLGEVGLELLPSGASGPVRGQVQALLAGGPVPEPAVAGRGWGWHRLDLDLL